MSKVLGVRERLQQPYWDSIVRIAANTVPSPVIAQQTRLFVGASNPGQTEWTNMQSAGVLPSDNTYILLCLRVFLHFTSTNALTMYQQVAAQLYLTLTVGEKPMFAAPAWFFPQGGGIHGFDSTTPSMTNGVPSQEATLRLAKPVIIPSRQNFVVTATFHDIGTTSVRTEYLNSSTSIGSREIKVFIDGLYTRDVQ